MPADYRSAEDQHLRTSVEIHGAPQKYKMERETRLEFTLHRLDLSTFSLLCSVSDNRSVATGGLET
jgi:hypothetical protein